MNILGMDPGISGGVAVVDSRTMRITTGFRMPVFKEGKKKAVSPNHLARLTPVPVHHAVVERVHAMPGQGVSSTFSFGRSFGTAVAVASLCCSNDVILVTPQMWKAHFGLRGTGKGDSIVRAKEIFGSSYVWKYLKDDGIAEAALMAAWLIDTHSEIW